jgi:hypothetical protein
MSETATVTESNLKAIDVSALGDNTEIMEVDPTANAFDRSKPLPDARYKATIGLPSTEEGRKNMLKEGTVTKEGQYKGNKYYIVTAELKINEFLDPQADNKILQGKQRTFEMRFSSFQRMIDGKPTSEIATALVAMGAQISGKVGVGQLVAAFVQMLGGGALVGAETQWEAQVEGNEIGRNGKKLWVTVKRGEKNFPIDPAGGHNPEITVGDKQGRARAEIKSIFKIS